LKSIRDEQNQITSFDYNLDGTFREKRYFNALIPTPGVKLTYDPNYRRVLAMEDGAGLTTFDYHPITGTPSPNSGKLASVDGPLPNDTLTFTYDELGREAAWSMNGQRVQRSWDAAGRMTQLTNILGAFTYAWEGASRRLSAIHYPNAQRTTFSYFANVKDQLLQQITQDRKNDSDDPFSKALNPLFTGAGDALQGKESGGSQKVPCASGPARMAPAAQEKDWLDSILEWFSSSSPPSDPSDPKHLSRAQISPKTKPFIPPAY
jgi:YD repeat-containing protein